MSAFSEEIKRAHLQGKAEGLIELGNWLLVQEQKHLVDFAPADMVLTEINIRVEKLKRELEKGK